MKPNLLFVTRQWPARTGGGTPMRMGITLEALARDYAVHLLLIPASPRPVRGPMDTELEKLCAAAVSLPTEDAADPAYDGIGPDSAPEDLLAAALASPLTYLTGRATPAAIAQASAAYATVSFDWIHVCRLYMAPYVEPLLRVASRPRPRLVLDLDDIESRTLSRIADLHKLAGDPIMERVERLESEKHAVMEQVYLPLFDEVWVCSHLDAEAVRREYSHPGVLVVPNAIRAPAQPASKTSSDVYTLLFVGAMGYYPNRDAALWLCQEILPILQRKMDRPIRVILAGPRPGAQMEALARAPDVTVLGEVPALGPLYRDADMAVVPVRAGGGTRIKILEAFSYQRPVVSTTVGAEGFELTDGSEILLADTALEFAQACRKVLEDAARARAMSERAYRWVRAHHAPESVLEAIRKGWQVARQRLA